MFLDEVVAASRAGARERMDSVPLSLLERATERMSPAPDFRGAVSRKGGVAGIIAEIKRGSPSVGRIRAGARAGDMAGSYARSGAVALSVITCGYRFDGRLEDMREAVTAAPGVPLLRKDFITEEYQVVEARAHGASAVLLIVAALSDRRLRELSAAASDLGMGALVEAHTEAELHRALDCGARVVGINNRNLETLEVDLETTARLLPMVPPGLVTVSESGIRTSADLRRVSGLGVDAVLVGEALMRAEDPGARLRELIAGAGACTAGGEDGDPGRAREAYHGKEDGSCG